VGGLLKIQALHWDDANIEHSARHGLSPVDIEEKKTQLPQKDS
jgi:hypothetical protein